MLQTAKKTAPKRVGGNLQHGMKTSLWALGKPICKFTARSQSFAPQPIYFEGNLY
jgi:hypothetical protein